MKVLKEKIKNGINILTIGDIDIDNHSDVDNLKTIIKKFTQGNQYYFEYFRESLFLEEEEIIKYRTEIPEYINQNGIYTLKRKDGKEHLESVGYLKVTDEIYEQIIKMWNYFEGLSFFNPTNMLNWQEFDRDYCKIRPVQYGIGFVKRKFANAVFTKGHDGDHLIFVYGENYNHALVEDVVKFLNDL
jgi:hypothetical protein